MEFDVIGLDGLEIHQRQLSSGKEASYIIQWTMSTGDKVAKKVQKISVHICFYNFWAAEAAGAAHRRICANTCNPMPQCFQIWQVSAKYSTFLDLFQHF